MTNQNFSIKSRALVESSLKVDRTSKRTFFLLNVRPFTRLVTYLMTVYFWLLLVRREEGDAIIRLGHFLFTSKFVLPVNALRITRHLMLILPLP